MKELSSQSGRTPAFGTNLGNRLTGGLSALENFQCITCDQSISQEQFLNDINTVSEPKIDTSIWLKPERNKTNQVNKMFNSNFNQTLLDDSWSNLDVEEKFPPTPSPTSPLLYSECCTNRGSIETIVGDENMSMWIESHSVNSVNNASFDDKSIDLEDFQICLDNGVNTTDNMLQSSGISRRMYGNFKLDNYKVNHKEKDYFIGENSKKMNETYLANYSAVEFHKLDDEIFKNRTDEEIERMELKLQQILDDDKLIELLKDEENSSEAARAMKRPVIGCDWLALDEIQEELGGNFLTDTAYNLNFENETFEGISMEEKVNSFLKPELFDESVSEMYIHDKPQEKLSNNVQNYFLKPDLNPFSQKSDEFSSKPVNPMSIEPLGTIKSGDVEESLESKTKIPHPSVNNSQTPLTKLNTGFITLNKKNPNSKIIKCSIFDASHLNLNRTKIQNSSLKGSKIIVLDHKNSLSFNSSPVQNISPSPLQNEVRNDSTTSAEVNESSTFKTFTEINQFNNSSYILKHAVNSVSSSFKPDTKANKFKALNSNLDRDAHKFNTKTSNFAPEPNDRSNTSLLSSVKRPKMSLESLSDAEKYLRIRMQNNAASKRCRQRKKDMLLHIKFDVQTAEERNVELRSENHSLKLRRDKWKELFLTHVRNQKPFIIEKKKF